MVDQVNADIGTALGRIPSGCFILTVRSGDKSTGMLASWVQQAGFEPPTVTVSIKKGRHIEQLVEQAGMFVLNVLAEGSGALLKHFARGFGSDDDAFGGLTVQPREAGVVLTDCPAHLACRVRARYDAGDHWLYWAEVIGGTAEPDAAPWVHLRKNGFNY